MYFMTFYVVHYHSALAGTQLRRRLTSPTVHKAGLYSSRGSHMIYLHVASTQHGNSWRATGLYPDSYTMAIATDQGPARSLSNNPPARGSITLQGPNALLN